MTCDVNNLMYDLMYYLIIFIGAFIGTAFVLEPDDHLQGKDRMISSIIKYIGMLMLLIIVLSVLMLF